MIEDLRTGIILSLIGIIVVFVFLTIIAAIIKVLSSKVKKKKVKVKINSKVKEKLYQLEIVSVLAAVTEYLNSKHNSLASGRIENSGNEWTNYNRN